MGAAGFRALLARALVLAAADAPWLGSVRVTAGGALEGLDGAAAPVSEKAFVRGGVELIAQLLGLLTTFIGDDLTLRLVREVWPGATLGNKFSQNGAINEKTN